MKPEDKLQKQKNSIPEPKKKNPLQKENKSSVMLKKAVRGMGFEEQKLMLKPDNSPLSLRELDPKNPLLKENYPEYSPSSIGVRSDRNTESGNPAGNPGISSEGSKEKKPSGTEIGAVTTNEGTTVSVGGRKVRLDLKVFHSVPTSLTEDGAFAAVRINPEGNVKMSAGAGYLPKLYAVVPGPRAKYEEPRVIGFFSIDAKGNVLQIPVPAGCTFEVNAKGDMTLAVPIDLAGREVPSLGDMGKHPDIPLALGMSNIDAELEARITKDLGGNAKGELGYKAFTDILFNATRYNMGATGLPVSSHILSAGVHGKTKDMEYDVSASVPIASPTNRYATSPQLDASIRPESKYVPNLDLRLGTSNGVLNYAGLSKDLKAGKANINLSAGVIDPLHSETRDFKASAGVRVPLGGGGPKSSFKSDLYEHTRRTEHSGIPEGKSYQAGECFTPEEMKILSDFVSKHKPDEQGNQQDKATEEDLKWLSDILKTPERIAAFFNEYWTYDEERLNRFKGGEGIGYDRSAYSALENLNLMKSVCIDYANFWTNLLEKQGYEARTVAYIGPDTGHVICVFKDKNGKWNVLDNGTIFNTQSSSMESALEKAVPEAWCYLEYSRPSDDMIPIPISKTETRDLQRILRFMRGE
jgi:hypothetical protein